MQNGIRVAQVIVDKIKNVLVIQMELMENRDLHGGHSVEDRVRVGDKQPAAAATAMPGDSDWRHIPCQ